MDALINGYKNSSNTSKPVYDFDVFTEKDFYERISLNTPYLPDHFTIILFKRGSIRVLYNLAEYTVEKSSVILVAPKSLYEIQYLSDDCEMIAMVFNENFLADAGMHLNVGIVVDLLKSDIKRSFDLEEEDLATLLGLFKLLHKKKSLKHLSLLDHKVLTHCFSTIMYECVSIFNRYNKIYKAKLNRKEELALHFIELLSVNFEKERSVTYYGHQLHITPKYLTETMKEITGKTAGELIDQAVIMQAKVLLSNPSLNINQVAEALNFSDQSFFGKFFKKHVGVSPLKYRSTSRYKPTFKPK